MKNRIVRIPTEDGLILPGLLSEPDVPTGKGFVHIHGMAGSFYGNPFLDVLAETLAAAGWSFLRFNNRGSYYTNDFDTASGGDRRIGNTYELFEESVHDVKAGIDFLDRLGCNEIVLQGHSLGGPKVVNYLAETGDARVGRLVLASPADMVGLAEISDGHEERMAWAAKAVAEGRGREVWPQPIWGEDGWEGYLLSAQTYLSLHQHGGAVDCINTHAPDVPSRLGAVTVPILAFFGSENESVLGEPADMLAILHDKATGASRFDMAVIEGAGHNYRGYEHEVVELVTDWLAEAA